MERDGNLFNADGIEPKELENYKLVQCLAFNMQSSLKCLYMYIYKFYFRISSANICKLFPFLSRTIMGQLKVSQVQRFVKYCEKITVIPTSM